MRATVSATWQHHTALIGELRALGRSRLRTTDTASARVPRNVVCVATPDPRPRAAFPRRGARLAWLRMHGEADDRL